MNRVNPVTIAGSCGKRCLFPVAAVLLICCDAFAQTGIDTDNKRHFQEVAEAHRANIDSWKRGDVIFRVNVDGDGRLFDQRVVEGPEAMSLLTRSRRIYRLIFDFTTGQYLLIRRGSGSVEAFDSLDDPVVVEGVYPTKQQSIRLVLVDPVDQVALQKIQAGKVTRLPAKTEFEFQAERAGVPMIPGFGLFSLGTWNLSNCKRGFERMTNPDQIAEVSHVGADRYRSFYNFEQRRLSIQTDWDVINFVPLQQRIFRVRETGEIFGEPISEESVRWKEVNHSMVPVRFHQSSVDIVTYDAKSFRRDVTTQIDLHWFSLNEELDAKVFAPETLTDPSKLETLLDESVFDQLK